MILLQGQQLLLQGLDGSEGFIQFFGQFGDRFSAVSLCLLQFKGGLGAHVGQLISHQLERCLEHCQLLCMCVCEGSAICLQGHQLCLE
jgi:hypothetical protein